MKLYSKPNCPKCLMLMRLLEKKKISYNYIDITKDSDAFEKLSELNFLSLPIVELDGKFITNYDELIKMFK